MSTNGLDRSEKLSSYTEPPFASSNEEAGSPIVRTKRKAIKKSPVDLRSTSYLERCEMLRKRARLEVSLRSENQIGGHVPPP